MSGRWVPVPRQAHHTEIHWLLPLAPWKKCVCACFACVSVCRCACFACVNVCRCTVDSCFWTGIRCEPSLLQEEVGSHMAGTPHPPSLLMSFLSLPKQHLKAQCATVRLGACLNADPQSSASSRDAWPGPTSSSDRQGGQRWKVGELEQRP